MIPDPVGLVGIICSIPYGLSFADIVILHLFESGLILVPLRGVEDTELSRETAEVSRSSNFSSSSGTVSSDGWMTMVCEGMQKTIVHITTIVQKQKMQRQYFTDSLY